MPIDRSTFWQTEDVPNPPLTPEMVQNAEKRLGVKLPRELIELLSIQNGGYTESFDFPTDEPTSWAEDHVPVDELFGIGPVHAENRSQDILETAYMTKEWGLPPKQVLLCGDGHWWITLDYRKGDEACVSWIDVECEEELELAPSFAAFLDGLLPIEEFETADEDD